MQPDAYAFTEAFGRMSGTGMNRRSRGCARAVAKLTRHGEQEGEDVEDARIVQELEAANGVDATGPSAEL